jgi:hypothetical protein
VSSFLLLLNFLAYYLLRRSCRGDNFGFKHQRERAEVAEAAEAAAAEAEAAAGGANERIRNEGHCYCKKEIRC